MMRLLLAGSGLLFGAAAVLHVAGHSHVKKAPIAATQAGYSYPKDEEWQEYGSDAQHDGLGFHSQPLGKILWQASVDDDRSYYGGEVLIHYACPLVSQGQTVIHSYRYTTTVSSSPDYDNWAVIGRSIANGNLVWQVNTDYSAPIISPGGDTNSWTSVYPMCLATDGIVAMAGAGGTVLLRANADAASSTVRRGCPYTTGAIYAANPSLYSNIKICTPLMADHSGNIWYGYEVIGTVPPNLANALGTGGVVRMSVSGAPTFKSVNSFNLDSSVARPAMNASPALSTDGTSVYFGVTDTGQTDGWLIKLNSTTLALEDSVHIIDPSVPGGGARLIDESSASPMVGPDGHVFYGVFGYYYRESHGWMMQFDGNLNPNNSTGVKWPTGSFGWDDTASVVPANLVPSYTGTASYLVLTKYNNYAMATGNGENKLAVLDPTSDSISTDRQTGIPVMNEILTILGPTPDPNKDSTYPNAVDEWCINSAAIDEEGDSAIVNSEDGHCYRWNFSNNTLTQATDLAPATGEAYTSTAIAENGVSFAINNSILFAVGTNAALGPGGYARTQKTKVRLSPKK